jgi:hypothetical protein
MDQAAEVILSPVDWAQIVSAIGAMVAAGIAAYSARFSRQSAHAALQAVEATDKYGKAHLYAQLWDEYGSPDTYTHINLLRDYKVPADKDEIPDKMINSARYLFNFYHRVYLYHEAELIDKNMMLKLTDASGYGVTRTTAGKIMDKVYAKHDYLKYRSDWFDKFKKVVGDARRDRDPRRVPSVASDH